MVDDNITPGELARRMQDVLLQFSALVDQVENRYVRKDLLELYKQGIDTAILGVSSQLGGKADKSSIESLSSTVSDKVSKADYEALKSDVAELKDTNKWLSRLVIGIIIAAVLGAVIASGGLK